MIREGQLDIRKRFGRAVRQRRQELAISQEELTSRAQLHRTYVGDIERGARNLSLENIEKIARALGLRMSSLFSKYGVDD